MNKQRYKAGGYRGTPVLQVGADGFTLTLESKSGVTTFDIDVPKEAPKPK